jgi:hypothetical protein
MTASRRKSFAKALSQKVGEIPKAEESPAEATQDAPIPTPPTPKREPVKFNKFTFPLREDLHRRLSKAIAHLNLEQDIEVSMAILIRLGIEHVLEQLENNPDALLEKLYQLEQKEIALSGDKRYTVNRGLEEYVQKTSQTARNT